MPDQDKPLQPPQKQDHQPGIEAEMRPQPGLDASEPGRAQAGEALGFEGRHRLPELVRKSAAASELLHGPQHRLLDVEIARVLREMGATAGGRGDAVRVEPRRGEAQAV